MKRTTLYSSFCILALAAASKPSHPAHACSLITAVEAEERNDLPSNAQFNAWFDAGSVEEFRLELSDEAGRVVPAAVSSHTIPQGRFYKSGLVHAVLRPLADLAAGTYRLRVNPYDISDEIVGPRFTFQVTQGPIHDLPPPPGSFKAVATRETCRTNTRPDCSAITGDCDLVALEFENDAAAHWDQALTYELSWIPMSDQDTDSSRLRSASGFRAQAKGRARSLRIPIWWFAGLREEHTRIRLQLRAIDAAGIRSEPAEAVVPLGELRVKADHAPESSLPTRQKIRAVEFRYLQDLPRFAEAAAPTESGIFELLEPIGSSQRGAPYDDAFRKAVLAQDGWVSMKARLRGARMETHVRMDVEVRDGRVYAPVTTPDVQELLSKLPMERSEVRKVALWTVSYGWTQIGVTTERVGQSGYTWRPSSRPDIRVETQELLRIRDLVEADPLYRALAEAHGPSAVMGHCCSHGQGTASAGFRGSGPAGSDRHLRATFSLRPPSSIAGASLHGSLGMCRVGALAPMVAAVAERLGSPDADLESTPIHIEIRQDGQVDLEVQRKDGRAGGPAFVGRLGTPLIRAR